MQEELNDCRDLCVNVLSLNPNDKVLFVEMRVIFEIIDHVFWKQ